MTEGRKFLLNALASFLGSLTAGLILLMLGSGMLGEHLKAHRIALEGQREANRYKEETERIVNELKR